MEKIYSIGDPTGSGMYALVVTRSMGMMGPSYAVFYCDKIVKGDGQITAYADGVTVTVFADTTPYILIPREQLVAQTNSEAAAEHKAEQALIDAIMKEPVEKPAGGVSGTGVYI